MAEHTMGELLDINRWWAKYRPICPNCGTDFTNAPEYANLYPHFTGACKSEPAVEASAGVASLPACTHGKSVTDPNPDCAYCKPLGSSPEPSAGGAQPDWRAAAEEIAVRIGARHRLSKGVIEEIIRKHAERGQEGRNGK